MSDPMSDWLATVGQTLGTILTRSFVHRLEPLNLLLRILVWDGADCPSLDDEFQERLHAPD